jgi:exonuclease III
MRIATYNIRNGRVENLEIALRVVAQLNVDIAILTEVKLTDDRFTNYSHGYGVIATKAKSSAQGGLALVSRSSEAWQLESFERHGPNVIGFELVTGNRRYSCVGVYSLLRMWKQYFSLRKPWQGYLMVREYSSEI